MKLNNIPLELDNRISDIADIKTVITADENDVGKMGYFANSIHLFTNLEGRDGIKYGKLIYLSDLDYGGDKSDKCFVCSNQWAYRYFIPEDALKPDEKQYRPYNNVQELFEDIGVYIGDTIHFRSKAKGTESHSLITSYTTLKDGTEKICLGGAFYYTMQALFDLFELRSRGEWIPFGLRSSKMIELDERILDGKKPLTAFDEIGSKFIGTDCYFSDDASDFMDVSKYCQIGSLLRKDEATGVFSATKNNSYAVFNYCLPCEWVEEEKKQEPKYRPYTMEEFIREYTLGESIFKIRDKRDPDYVYEFIYIGHSNSLVYLGGWTLSLDDLFAYYELELDDEWQPFGKEIEE